MSYPVTDKKPPSTGSVFLATVVLTAIQILVAGLAIMEGLPRLFDDVLKTEYTTHPGYWHCVSFTIFLFVFLSLLKQYVSFASSSKRL